MNGMISLQISDEGLRRANQALHQIQSQFPQAVARAVNRTMDGLKTDAVRETTAKYFVKAKDVRASLSFRKATADNLMGAMVSKGKHHSLADYKLTLSLGKRPSVKGAVKKAGGLKPLSRKGDGMTELNLLDALVLRLTENFAVYELKAKSGLLQTVRVFAQYLPQPSGITVKPKDDTDSIVPQGYTSTDIESNFPCVIVKLDESTDSEEKEN